MGEEKQGEIKVTDRRHFNADGTPRAPIDSESEVETVRPSFVEAPGSPLDSGSQAPASHRAAVPESPLFLEFLAGLVGGAASQLGLVAHPGSGQTEVDLDGAKQMIDILTALQEKTKGNLTPSEQKFLDDALTQLRMVYVRATSQPR